MATGRSGEAGGTHRCFDLMKHIGGSLSQEQSDYGYSVQKGEFNYSNACKWEDMG